MHHVGIELARDRLRKSAFTRSVINAEMFRVRPLRWMPASSTPWSAPTSCRKARVQRQQLKKLNMTAHRNTKLKVRKALLETLDQAIRAGQEAPGLRPAAAKAQLVPGFLRPIITYYAKVTLLTAIFKNYYGLSW